MGGTGRIFGLVDAGSMNRVNERPDHPLEVAFALAELGARMVAERFRREHPDASEPEVEAAVRAWISDRPGAPFGDAEGRPVSWPRSS